MSCKTFQAPSHCYSSKRKGRRCSTRCRIRVCGAYRLPFLLKGCQGVCIIGTKEKNRLSNLAARCTSFISPALKGCDCRESWHALLCKLAGLGWATASLFFVLFLAVHLVWSMNKISCKCLFNAIPKGCSSAVQWLAPSVLWSWFLSNQELLWRLGACGIPLPSMRLRVQFLAIFRWG